MDRTCDKEEFKALFLDLQQRLFTEPFPRPSELPPCGELNAVATGERTLNLNVIRFTKSILGTHIILNM